MFFCLKKTHTFCQAKTCSYVLLSLNLDISTKRHNFVLKNLFFCSSVLNLDIST